MATNGQYEPHPGTGSAAGASSGPPGGRPDEAPADSAHEKVYDESHASAHEAAVDTDRDRVHTEPDEAVRRTLLSRWSALLASARDGSAGPSPAPYGEALLSRWSQPHRRYHTEHHLLHVLRRIDELAPHCSGSPGGAPEPDLDAVLLAAWFHDAVHRPDRSENEERSARLAERALPEAGVGAARTAEAARLVRLTASHDPAPDDTAGALLCDADLAVLARPAEAYAHYASQVRQEYGFLPDHVFRAGRSAVLRELLGRERLFRTEYGHRQWERTARHNMAAEWELLTS